MPRAPAFQFYPADWLRDPEWQSASAAARGTWINALCRLWYADHRGRLTGTPTEMARLLGCSEGELAEFIAEANRLKFADATFCNGVFTLENRRMLREEKERNQAVMRMKRFRNAHVDAVVTDASSSSSSSSTSKLVKDSSPDPSNNGSGAPYLPEWFQSVLKQSPVFAPLVGEKFDKFWRAMSAAYDPYEWLKWDEQIQRADAWIAANPQRRPKDLRRFLQNWFSRAVERGRVRA